MIIKPINRSVLRFVLTFGLLYIIIGVSAQPTETIYQGTVIRTGYANNNAFGPFNIGFEFKFFGNIYTEFYVNTNGMVTFDTLSTDPSEDAIPDTLLPDNYIAAFWDDLVVDPSGNILYTTIGAAPNRKLIVQFRNMGFYSGPTYLGTFSVILYETSNKIQVQYRSIILPSSANAHGASATFGLEDSTGTSGVQFAWHDPAAITSGQAVSYTPVDATYNINENELFDGVYLTTNLVLPEPGIVNLISPDNDAIIGSSHVFRWSASPNAASYSLRVSTNANLSGATIFNAGNATFYKVDGLVVGQTYYWGVFASNATGTTWCEIKKFTVSATPPISAVPQTFWVELGKEKIVRLSYTGGDGSNATAQVTTLPPEGELYQVLNGSRGARITSVPSAVTDPECNVIFIASGGSGNGAGNFDFRFSDNTGTSPAATVTVNITPAGVPNVLFIAKTTTAVEIQFDIKMEDPAGKEPQFMVIADFTGIEVRTARLKSGDPYTIELVLATPLSGSEVVTVSYTQGDIKAETGGYLYSFYDYLISLVAQTIDFSQPLDFKLNESPVTLSATAGSGLAVTYSSSNLSVATISGNIATLLSSGTSEITARQSGNDTYAPARFTRTLTVSDPIAKTLNLSSVLLQGLYNGGGIMRQARDDYGSHWPAGIADHITIELHDASDYSIIFYTASDVPLTVNGSSTVSIPAEYNASYYVTIKNRNHIETTTAVAVSFAAPEISISFGSQSVVYGGNLGSSGDGGWLIFGGDVDQDDFVGVGDMVMVDNLSAAFGSGYLVEDVDGDGFVGVSDMIIIDNNSAGFVSAITP